MRFTKIKISKGKVRLEYEIKSSKGDMDEYSLNCSDEPLLSFKDALQVLDQDVIEMCELPKDYISKITVTGVSFSYGGENQVMGATITASMKLNHSNVPLLLNTPHKAEEPYSETGDETQLLSEDCVERLRELDSEAAAYARGNRAQGNLFKDDTETRGHGDAEKVKKIEIKGDTSLIAMSRFVKSTKDGPPIEISFSGHPGEKFRIEKGKVTKMGIDAMTETVDPETGEILDDLPDADRDHPFYNGKPRPDPEGAPKKRKREARA